MTVSTDMTITKNLKLKTMNYLKRTQTNPILSKKRTYQSQNKPNLGSILKQNILPILPFLPILTKEFLNRPPMNILPILTYMGYCINSDVNIGKI
jgi:hypothetical protein